MPERAGEWKTKELSFWDRPDDKYVIQHRDVIEAI